MLLWRPFDAVSHILHQTQDFFLLIKTKLIRTHLSCFILLKTLQFGPHIGSEDFTVVCGLAQIGNLAVNLFLHLSLDRNFFIDIIRFLKVKFAPSPHVVLNVVLKAAESEVLQVCSVNFIDRIVPEHLQTLFFRPSFPLLDQSLDQRLRPVVNVGILLNRWLHIDQQVLNLAFTVRSRYSKLLFNLAANITDEAQLFCILFGLAIVPVKSDILVQLPLSPLLLTSLVVDFEVEGQTVVGLRKTTHSLRAIEQLLDVLGDLRW